MDIRKIVKLALEKYDAENFEEALKLFKKAFNSSGISLRDKAILYRNMGLCHYSKANWSAAELNFQKSVDLGHKVAEWELGLSQLQQKNINGLKYYKSRLLKENTFPDLPIKNLTTLQHIDTAKKILVLNEQGFGDELLFSRGLNLLQGKDFNWQVYPEMIDLFNESFTGSFFTDRVLSREFVMAHDGWISTGELFTLYTLNKGFEPIFINSQEGNPRKVGLCLSSNPNAKIAQKKSIPIEWFEPLVANYENIEWISLQYNNPIHFATQPDLGTFLDTKKVIDELDIIITVDTAVAHLAGAMNKKVIMVYKEYFDWRWLFQFWNPKVETCQINLLGERLDELFPKK